MRILMDLLVAYVIYMLGTALLVLRQTKRDRVAGLAIVWIAPFLSIISFVIATAQIVIRRPLLASACPQGLESAEQAVAEKRQQMFGGVCARPQVAAQWKKHYAFALEYEASRIQKFASKLTNFHLNLRVAS